MLEMGNFCFLYTMVLCELITLNMDFSSLFIFNFNFLFLTVLGLHCCTQGFSSCPSRGNSSCGGQAFHCSSFSCCRARGLGCAGFTSCGTWA